MNIGLLMVNGENDILERTLNHNTQFVDVFYALDGTQPNDESKATLTGHPKCAGYLTDQELPRPPYPAHTVCGYRRAIHEQAVNDHGPDHWFVILHADEIWTAPPQATIRGHDGYIFDLPFFFPREGEPWDHNRHPLDQLHWNLRPGFPEFRLFKGGQHVHYSPTQRFNVRPDGLRSVGRSQHPILHYPYRAPDVQRARTEQHQRTQFDPDNYAHIADGDNVYWTDQMIADRRRRPYFRELAEA